MESVSKLQSCAQVTNLVIEKKIIKVPKYTDRELTLTEELLWFH